MAKKHLVVPRTEAAMKNGIQTSKGRLDFGKQTGVWVDNDIASEIDTESGLKGKGDVWVHEDENLAWHEHNDSATDGRKLGIHHYTFQGVDMSGVKTTRDNGYVWVQKNGRQVRMKREEALNEGYEIIKKRFERRKSAEAVNVS